MHLLTSAQQSAEVRALQRALSFYLSIFLSFGVCVSAVCGLCFTDLRRVAFSWKQRIFISFTITLKPRAQQQQHSAVLGEGLGTRNPFAVQNQTAFCMADVCWILLQVRSVCHFKIDSSYLSSSLAARLF